MSSAQVDPSLEEDFERAAAFLRGIAGKLDAADLLYFYGRFKQAKAGPNDTSKPGFFDFQGKQKWQAWKDLGDMPKETAMREYVDKLEEIDPEWAGKEPEKGGSWVSVSAMVAPDEEAIANQDKSLFDWVKEGNAVEVRKRLKAGGGGGADASKQKDGDGMGLIHWAADRGDVDVLNALLDAGADVNQVDGDGQTALHFASSCGHSGVASALLTRNADVDARDSDGLTAAEVASDKEMKEMLLAATKRT